MLPAGCRRGQAQNRSATGACSQARLLAWFRVLVLKPLVKPSNSLEALSRLEDYFSLHDLGRPPALSAILLQEEPMPPRSKKKTFSSKHSLPVLNPNTAGIDIGATEIYVAVPPDRSEHSVRSFPTFTQDLLALKEWLKACSIKSVAMESTGVYWIPLYQILEKAGLEVCLVNARHVKNVPGRKSDVSDCQWLQHLHAAGLLRGSFRPNGQVCAVRSLVRHRDNLVKMASEHVQHMQKALTQMNIQLHNVISDITGVTGLAIIEALLAGQRDPNELASFKDRRIKATKAIIAKSLVGNYTAEHLFVLKQSLESYKHYQLLIHDCDAQIQALLQAFDSQRDPAQNPLPAITHRVVHKPQRNQPKFDLRSELYRITGVDLTSIPGINALTAYTVFAEIGQDISKFPSAKHFASWLGLCPNNKVSGGKVLSAKTRCLQNRAAHALRLAAQSLWRSPTALGHAFRARRARLGPPKAITATAHQLARIIYHLLQSKESYDHALYAAKDQLLKRKAEAKLKAQAKLLGFAVVPIQNHSTTG